jgi:iron-sulfur cluster repair protein YtfE (RIC family)
MPAPMPSARAHGGDQRMPDLCTYVLVHRAIRRDLSRLSGLADEVVSGERRIRAGEARQLGAYVRDLVTCLDGHLDVENEILWPVVASAAGAAVDIGPLVDDHHALDDLIARAASEVDGWLRTPDDRRAAAGAATALRDLRDLFDEHITEEERDVFPIVAEYVDAAEYDRCEKRIQATTAGSVKRFLVPWLMAVATPAEKASALHRGGWRMRLVLAVSQRRYAARAAAVFG